MGFPGYLEELLKRAPSPASTAANLIVLRRVDSTQRLARRLTEEYFGAGRPAPPATLVAYEQTAGRGRQGRPWSSPAGLGVFVTLVRPLSSSAALHRLPLVVGLALAEALDPFLEEPCRLKWPNDLMVQGCKIGGILLDARCRPGGEVVTLLGFGVNHSHGPKQLPIASATSLALCATSMPSLEELTWRLVHSVDSFLPRLGEERWAAEAYSRRSIHRDGDALRCQIGTRRIEGIFRGFDSQGYLRLETEEGEELITAGEIVEGRIAR